MKRHEGTEARREGRGRGLGVWANRRGVLNAARNSLLTLQQPEDIGADFGGVLVPLWQPMAVDFPSDAGWCPALHSAPLLDRLMGLGELVVRPEVRHGRNL